MCSRPARPPVWPWRRVAPVSPCNTEPRRLGPGSMSQRAGPLAAGRAIHPAERDEGGRAGAPHRRAARHAAAAARCRACAAARRPPARAGARSWPPRGCAAARTRAPARARGRGLRHALILSCGRPGKRAWQPREWPARAHARTGQAGASLCLQAARSSTPSGGWQPPGLRRTAHRAGHTVTPRAPGDGRGRAGAPPIRPWRPVPVRFQTAAHLPVSLGGHGRLWLGRRRTSQSALAAAKSPSARSSLAAVPASSARWRSASASAAAPPAPSNSPASPSSSSASASPPGPLPASSAAPARARLGSSLSSRAGVAAGDLARARALLQGRRSSVCARGCRALGGRQDRKAGKRSV